MGEVYRVRDLRLGREVALKVLPSNRLAGPVRRGRFLREAQAASALNHPNIVTIHEIETADGIDFIVMELVSGRTLDAVVPRQGMPLSEALPIAIALADGLAAAHGSGVVHRDFKPANVMLTREGVAKILDFGLAKLEEADPADENASTLDGPSALTHPGVVVGTPAYMSPEQAAGRTVDARTDIFSFGVVLYEMITGRRPFSGRSTAESLAALANEQPRPPSELVADLPRDLERIILRCLRKQPERRFQSMLDVKVELLEVQEESDSPASMPTGSAGMRRFRRRGTFWTLASLLTLASVAAMVSWRLQPEHPSTTLVQLTAVRHAHVGSFSPDGAQIAFTATGESDLDYDIWLKIVGQAEARRLTMGSDADKFPAWAPDGENIAFVRSPALGSTTETPEGAVHLVSPLGGPGRRLADLPVWGPLSWSPGGRWLAAARRRRSGETAPESGGIQLIPMDGGEPRALTFPVPPAYDVHPAFSPSGDRLGYVTCKGTSTSVPSCDVEVVGLDAEGRPHSRPRRLTQQGFWNTGLAWTRDGESLLFGDTRTTPSRLWRVPADGGAPPRVVELAGREAGWPFSAAAQDRVAFLRRRGDYDVWAFRADAESVPILTSTAYDIFPQYSPDGRRIAFQSFRESDTDEIWLCDADGSNPSRLTRGPGRSQGSPRWSPDGRTIAFDSQAGGHWDVWTIAIDGSGLRRMTHGPVDNNQPSWSRDGRWIYFASNRTGRYEIWRIAPGGGTEERMTDEGGVLPFESLDGGTLYYLRREREAPLLARPTAGGGERTIIECVARDFGYAVTREGILHLDCASGAGDNRRRPLRLWDARTEKDRLIATLDTGDSVNVLGLAVSPDGGQVLYTRSTRSEDLMMIDHFR